MRIRRKDLSRIIQEELRRVLREQTNFDVTLPPATSPPAVSSRPRMAGSLTQPSAEIGQKLQYCYERRLQGYVDFNVDITIEFQTDDQGSPDPDSVTVSIGDTNYPELAKIVKGCIEGKLKGSSRTAKLFLFHKFDPNARASWPIVFKPRS